MTRTPSELVDQEPDEWLPPGWTVKARFRHNGKRDRFYYSPSGERFNSKIWVCRHLGLDPKTTGINQHSIVPYVHSNSSTVGSNLDTETSTLKTPKKTISPKVKPAAQSTSLEKSKEQDKGGDGDYLPGKVYFERVPADGLPPGWIKEIKIQNICGKIRKDPFYFSPSGERFNSKIWVCRHLGLDPKTTGISQHSITPYVQSNSSTVGSNLATETSTLKTPRKTISPKVKPIAQYTPLEMSQEQDRGGDGDYLPGKVYFERVAADGLPPGWIKEIKIQNIRGKIRKDPFYFSPSGEKFNSKIWVCRHLGLDPKTTGISQHSITPYVQSNSSTVGSNLATETSTLKTPMKTISPKVKPAAQSTPLEKSKEQDRGGDGDYLPGKVYFERVPADGLPLGWIKEIKIQNICGKIRKDPFFTDPVSGYVFRSLKDTLRYIETGEPGRLAFKPKSPIAAETETLEVAGNKRKLRLSDGPVSISNERTPDEKDGTIRKSTKKGQPGARSSKIEIEHSLPRRSSGRLTALKAKTEVQITEQSTTTKNQVVAEEPFSSETSSCRGPRISFADSDSTDKASIFPNKTGSGNKRSPLLMSYEETWLDPCIDFAVKTLAGTATGKDLSVHDYIGQLQGDGNSTPPNFISNHVSQAQVGSGKWNNADVQKMDGSSSRCNWVRGTDRSLFR